jgi:hypothetical protein
MRIPKGRKFQGENCVMLNLQFVLCVCPALHCPSRGGINKKEI